MRLFFYFTAAVFFIFASPRNLFARDAQELIDHVIVSIQKAEQSQSRLDPDIMNIHGLSSYKVRHLLNNLCSLNDAVYLEIGCWKGSTLVAALYKNINLKEAIAVENWSEFEGPRNECFSNINKYVSSAPLRFVESDCFSLSKQDHFKSPVTIYFYDEPIRKVLHGKPESSDERFLKELLMAISGR